MGLVILGALALYLVLAIFVITGAIGHAKRHGQSVKRWGWSAALVMYLIPFWDWLPTVAVHQYYCATEAGFWVYKTPEQWKKENPGVLEALVNNKGAPSKRVGNMASYTDTYFLNARFNWVVKRHGKFFPNRWLDEEALVDVAKQEVLARYIDFSTSQDVPQAGWNGWKFWLQNDNCPGGRRNLGRMEVFKNNFRGAEK